MKRSIREVKHHVTSNGKREFVPRDQVSPLHCTCRLLFIFQYINYGYLPESANKANMFHGKFIRIKTINFRKKKIVQMRPFDS